METYCRFGLRKRYTGNYDTGFHWDKIISVFTQKYINYDYNIQ